MSLDSAQNAGMAQPDRRTSPRTNVPSIEIRCDGDLYITEDWGLGGCRISNYQGQWRPGTSALIELYLNIDHDHEGLPVRAEVVRFDPEHNNSLALCFVNLSAEDIIDFCDTVEEGLGAEVAKLIG